MNNEQRPIAEEYYFKLPKPEHERKCWFDEEGHLTVRNISAFWIPELTVTEVIHGTTYTVTGSYEGEKNFLEKLERITTKNFSEKMEKSL